MISRDQEAAILQSVFATTIEIDVVANERIKAKTPKTTDTQRRTWGDLLGEMSDA
ncbi:hypothetical protein GCM10010922_17720 [Microbacterium sorbitolivorans]|nr:hypothetical protein GCM10010922_17720 [Microbacterium sorbitolivorans]